MKNMTISSTLDYGCANEPQNSKRNKLELTQTKYLNSHSKKHKSYSTKVCQRQISNPIYSKYGNLMESTIYLIFKLKYSINNYQKILSTQKKLTKGEIAMIF